MSSTSPDNFPKDYFVQISKEEQLKLFNNQLRYAKENSSFYREHLLSVKELSSLEDLKNLPFTSAADLSRRCTDFVCIPASRISRIVTFDTSGTSAPPKRIWFSEEDLEHTIRFFASGMRWMCGPEDPVCICFEESNRLGLCDLLSQGLRRIQAIPYTTADPVTIHNINPKVIVGPTQTVLNIAHTLPQLKPKTALLSGEPVTKADREILRNLWPETRILEHFGMTETGYGCAVKHPSFSGMFLRKDELLAEIIDPETLNPLPFGQKGELVLTTLQREAMPLIRYRTGDLASMYDSFRLKCIYGRL